MKLLGYEFILHDECSYFAEMECDGAEFALALDEAYEQQKEKFTIEGYEKGQAPRAAVQAAKGDDVFYYDAVNIMIDRYVESTIEEICAKNGWVPLTKPNIDISACSEEDGLILIFRFMISPKVTLGQYKGLTFAYPPIPCPDGAVEVQLELLRQRAAAQQGKDTPLPALDDAFARDFCGAEDLATLRKEIAAGLAQHIAAQSRRQGMYLLLEEIGRNCTIERWHFKNEANLMHPTLLAQEYDRGMKGLKENLDSHGISMEAYLAQHGKTEDEFKADQRAGAERSLRGKLAAYAIAQAEGIVVKPIEVEAEQVRLSGKFNISVSDFKANEPAFLVRNDLLLTRTLAFLTKNNTLVEKGAATK